MVNIDPENLYTLFSYFYIISFLIPFYFAYQNFKKFVYPINLILIWLNISILLEIFSWISINNKFLLELTNRNNLFIQYLYNFSNLFLVGVFFSNYYPQRKDKLVIRIGLISLILFLVTEGLFISSFKNYNKFSALSSYIFFLILLIRCFRNLIINQKKKSIRDEYLFWFIIAFLLYLSAYTFLNIFSDPLIDYSANLFFTLGSFVYLINILSNILYAKGFSSL